jgi:hypothetical protein
MTEEEQATLDAALADVQALKAELADAQSARMDANAELALSNESKEHLARDHRVWARAWPSAPSIRPQGNPLETDAPAQHVELLARAALTDSIAEVCDGQRAGLERAVLVQLRAILGDPEIATIVATLNRLREADSDEQMPAGVTAKTRAPIAALTEVSQKLEDGDARKLIAKIMNATKAPPAGLPDLLYRLLKQSKGITDADAESGYSAAQAIETAFKA